MSIHVISRHLCKFMSSKSIHVNQQSCHFISFMLIQVNSCYIFKMTYGTQDTLVPNEKKKVARFWYTLQFYLFLISNKNCIFFFIFFFFHFFFFRHSAIFHVHRRNNSSQCLLRHLKMRVNLLTAPSIIILWVVTQLSTIRRAQRCLTLVIKWLYIKTMYTSWLETH
jgi:hypothetical protein